MKNLVWIIVIIVLVALGGYFLFRDDDMSTTPEMSNEVGYMDVSATEAKALIDENPDLIIIDVSPHYDNGHIPGAINYYPQTMIDDAIPTLDKEATYLIYCHVDSASRSGAQKFVDAGFMNVYRLEGHYSGWVDAGYEIEI
jgi:rhodanese-related sulfurtransferase